MSDLVASILAAKERVRRRTVQRELSEMRHQLRMARERQQQVFEAARCVALEALDCGYTEVQVAKEIGVDRMTVRKWRGKR